MQHAYGILRLVTPSLLTYHMRTLPPQDTIDACELLDKGVVELLARKMGSADTFLTNAEARNQIFLPLQLGGLGFRAAHELAPLAYMASVAQISSILHPLSPGVVLSGLIDAYNYVRDRKFKLPLIPDKAEQFVGFLAGQEEKKIGHLQRRFTAVWDNAFSSSLFTSLKDAGRARILSLRNRPAGLWLSTLPTFTSYALSNQQFQIALRLRLGLKQHPMLSDVCVCGESLAEDPSHFLGCQRLAPRSVTRRHNSIVHTLARLAREFGVEMHVEPRESRHMVDGKDRHPDLRSYRLNALVDVAIVHPCARTYVAGAAVVRGSAAKTRERDKHRKYDECAKREGVPFYSFILEGFGLIGSEAVKYVDALISAESTHPSYITDPRQMRPYFMRTLAFALQRGNAGIVTEGLDLNLGRA